MATAVRPVAQGSLLRIEGLAKDYGESQALRGIDLDVRPGEIFGFLGANGAGKSTTIRCVLDLLRPTAGRIAVFGLDPRRDGVAIRARVGYVPGELRLPDRWTARQLVDAIGRLRGGYDPVRKHQIADRLHLDLDKRMRDLSSGNRRKVALLQAFAADAELLILDEPTSGLDPLMQHEFLGMVREAREAGATVFLSSHDLGEVQRVADRVAVVRSGRVAATATVEELRRKARQRVEVWFADEPPKAELDALGILTDVLYDGRRMSAALSGGINALLGVLARSRIESIVIADPDLEEAFLELYGQTS